MFTIVLFWHQLNDRQRSLQDTSLPLNTAKHSNDKNNCILAQYQMCKSTKLRLLDLIIGTDHMQAIKFKTPCCIQYLVAVVFVLYLFSLVKIIFTFNVIPIYIGCDFTNLQNLHTPFMSSFHGFVFPSSYQKNVLQFHLILHKKRPFIPFGSIPADKGATPLILLFLSLCICTTGMYRYSHLLINMPTNSPLIIFAIWGVVWSS